MEICNICGNPIRWITENGRHIPIHIDGECSEKTSIIKSSHFKTSRYSNNDFCRLTKCPKCNGDVYFIRHNGGSVWVDEKEPPWPKHPCCNKPQNNRKFDKLKGAIQDIGNSMFGLVVQTRIVTNDNVSTIIAVKCNDNKGRCFLLSGSHEELHEQLVTICLRKPKSRINAIIKGVTKHYDILDDEKSPASIGLSQEWLKNPKQPKYNKHDKIINELNELNIEYKGNETYRDLKELLKAERLRIENEEKLKKIEKLPYMTIITPKRTSYKLLKELSKKDFKTVNLIYENMKNESKELLRLLLERKIFDLYFERKINELKKVSKNSNKILT